MRGTSCSVCLLQNWLISWWILSNTQSCSNIPFEWAETRGGGASRAVDFHVCLSTLS